MTTFSIPNFKNDLICNTIKYSLLFFPFSLVLGSFFINFTIIFASILSIYVIAKNNLLYLFRSNFFYFLTAFFVFLIFVSLVNNNLEIFLNSLKYSRFFFFTISFYLILKLDEKFHDNFIKIIVIVFCIILLDALFQYLFNFNLIGLEKKNPHRLSGMFGSELILGSLVSKYLPLILIFLFILKKNKFFSYIFLIFMLLVCFLSGERTAFLTSFFIVGLTLIKEFNLKKFLIFFSLVFLLIGVVIKFDKFIYERMIIDTSKNLKIMQNYNDLKSLKIYSDQHNSHFQSAYLMFKKGEIKHKLFGRGVKSFRKHCFKKEFCDTEGSCCSTHPHNIFFQALSETGIIGLILYFYFIFNVFTKVIAAFSQRNNIKYNNASYYILLGIIINYIPFTTSGNFFGTILSSNFFILLIFYKHNKNNNLMQSLK
jgi:O-antigen ligase